jgi:hypothetical protein
VNSFRPPSASIDLCHATEESFSNRGCSWTRTRRPFLFERPEARRGRPLVQHPKRMSWAKKSGIWRCFINKYKGRRRRWLDYPTFRGRLTKLLKKYTISLKMSKSEGPNIGSFIKKASSMRMNGMRISIIEIFAFDDASPLSAELQATPWPPSYKPPQLPMYDGHSDPKQFLMSYEATISSYGGNTAVMAKSFVMAVKNVAQTWYSYLRPGIITSWKKLKDMLITSFQGFQTKPVTAQALFQCTQDHAEYLQAYVRRFLRLRAQAPTVPNEIDIEAMIKGLRPGPTTQYFARKPPQTLEKLLQKMMNTSALIMTFIKEGRKPTGSLR